MPLPEIAKNPRSVDALEQVWDSTPESRHVCLPDAETRQPPIAWRLATLLHAKLNICRLGCVLH